MNWDLQQLRKSATDQKLDGICGGLGEHTPVPALVWRVAFVILAVCGGAGLLVYLLMWWLMPAADSTGAAAGSAWNLHALRRPEPRVELERVEAPKRAGLVRGVRSRVVAQRRRSRRGRRGGRDYRTNHRRGLTSCC